MLILSSAFSLFMVANHVYLPMKMDFENLMEKQSEEKKQGKTLSITNAGNGSKKMYIESYGCQMNFYDSDKISDLLKNSGYIITKDSTDADLVVFNTCHIRDKAVEKTYSDLGRIKKNTLYFLAIDRGIQ